MNTPPRKPIVRPIVLVPACNRMLGQHPFHVAGKKYIDAVRLAGCTPLIVPTTPIGEFADDLDALLAIAHGVYFCSPPMYQ